MCGCLVPCMRTKLGEFGYWQKVALPLELPFLRLSSLSLPPLSLFKGGREEGLGYDRRALSAAAAFELLAFRGQGL